MKIKAIGTIFATLVALAANLYGYGNTINFSGIITDVERGDDPDGIYAEVPTAAGDTFYGRINFSDDLTKVTADIYVGPFDQLGFGTAHFSLGNQPYDFSFGEWTFDGEALWFYTPHGGFGGSDGGVVLDSTYFSGLTSQFGSYWPPPFIVATGPVTSWQVNAPDTGSPLLLLGLGIVALLGFQKAGLKGESNDTQ